MNLQVRPLSNIATSIDYGLTASGDPEASGPKFLRITDIQDGTVDWSTVPHCVATKNESARTRLQIGDIVFARTGATTGKSYLIRHCPNDAVFASYLIRVRLNGEVDPVFVSHYFRTPDYWAQIAGSARGAAQMGVNATTLSSLRVPLPGLAAQRRIATILDQAEALRALRRTVLDKWDALAEAVFFDIFGDVVENTKGWPNTATLGEVASIVSGVTKGRKLTGTARSVPYLAVANVQDKALSLAKVKSIEASEEEISRYRLERNDLLLTEGGDPDKLGRGTLWRDELPECIHQNHVFRVRLHDERFTPVFLNWLVGSPRGKRYFLRSAKQTTGIASINMTQLRAFPLLEPPVRLQHKFARGIELIDALRSAHRAALAQSDALFAALQHRAFRGEL